MLSRVRLVASGSITALLALALSILPGSPGLAAPIVVGTLTLVPAIGAPGDTVSLTGKIAPAVKHHVQLQRRDGGNFVTLATKNTDSKGSFTFKAILPGDGSATASYRVLSPKMRDHTSRTYTTPIRNVAITPGTTIRITDGNNGSDSPAISGDGRYVTYSSYASDLVPGDSNGKADLFMWDLTTGTTTRITNGNSDAWSPAISADGAYVTYWSYASDLVPGDTNGTHDIFVWSRLTGTTTRVSDGNLGGSSPAISADGAYITYNGGGAYMWDRTTGGTTRITNDGEVGSLAISGDGRYVTYESGTNHIYVWDRTTGGATNITHSSESSLHPAISINGRYVTYYSWAPDLVPGDTNDTIDVFVWDRTTGATTRITDGNLRSFDPALSANGRYITYYSHASNLVRGDTNDNTDVFLWDRNTGTTSRITNGNASSRSPAISASGRYLAYPSDASDLVGNDARGSKDIFVFNR